VQVGHALGDACRHVKEEIPGRYSEQSVLQIPRITVLQNQAEGERVGVVHAAEKTYYVWVV
jgi:hypothetical protein